MNRRRFIKAGTISTLSFNSVLANSNLIPTPGEVEGPFYPVVAQKDQDFDLTIIKGHTQNAIGKQIFITGRVIDIEGKAIENATVDIWQANAAGRYSHPRDPNNAALDTNFQGWAIVQSGSNGEFKFKTVFPGAYPASGNWMRPPHIHFKVSKPGYVNLTTQMYFPDDPLNSDDLLLQRKPIEQQRLMIAKNSSEQPDTYLYQIVIEKA